MKQTILNVKRGGATPIVLVNPPKPRLKPEASKSGVGFKKGRGVPPLLSIRSIGQPGAVNMRRPTTAPN